MARYCNIPPDPRYADIIAMDRVNRGVAPSDVSLERRGHWIDRDAGGTRHARTRGEFGVPAGKPLIMTGPYVDLKAPSKQKPKTKTKPSSKPKPPAVGSTGREIADLSRRLGGMDIDICVPCVPKAAETRRHREPTAREVEKAKLKRRMSVPIPQPAVAPAMVSRSHSAPVNPPARPVDQPQNRDAKAPIPQPPSRRHSSAIPKAFPPIVKDSLPGKGGQPDMIYSGPVVFCHDVCFEARATYCLLTPVAPISQPYSSFPPVWSPPMQPAPMIAPGYGFSPGWHPAMVSRPMNPPPNAKVRQWRAGMELEDELDDVPEEGTICDAPRSSPLFDDIGSSVSKRAEDSAARYAARYDKSAPGKATSASVRPHSMSAAFADPAFRKAIVDSFSESSRHQVAHPSRHPSRISRSEWKRQEDAVLGSRRRGDA